MFSPSRLEPGAPINCLKKEISRQRKTYYRFGAGDTVRRRRKRQKRWPCEGEREEDGIRILGFWKCKEMQIN